jgi:hypothetical protein
MLAVFCLRLACGMLACLLLLSPRATNPRYYRTHFLTALGLACAAFLLVRETTAWPVLGWILAGAILAFLGSLSWSLDGAPGGRVLIVVTASVLAVGLCLFDLHRPVEETVPLGSRHLQVGPASRAGLLPVVLGDLTSAALLGTAVSAMLLGHLYLIAPTMSLRPLLGLLAAIAVAVLLRLAVDGWALGLWAREHSFANLGNDVLLWLPVRWVVGFAAPLGLVWMAWQTARIRSTQSATGILYVAVIFCFLGELTGQLLRSSGTTL